MIYVVDYEMVRRVDYFTVHPDPNSPFTGADTTDGIEGIVALGDMPFVFVQSFEIIGVDNGVFSLGKRYPSEGVAVAGPAIQQRQGYHKPRQPVRNRDGKIELNTTAPQSLRELVD